jgi:lon-related putative ATP-dependent protease
MPFVDTPERRLELAPEQLRRRLDPAELAFETTAEVEPLRGTIGQPRALDAIEFGLEVGAAGYNLFVAGTPGSGRTGTILDHLERLAATRPVPSNWVYVHNFEAPDRPNAIALPAGQGNAFARAVDEFLAGASREIPRAFESEDYQRRRQELTNDAARQRDALTGELQAFARERGFAVEMTPVGIVTIPLVEGKPLSAEQFAHLPPEEQRAIERRGAEIQDQVTGVVRRLRALEKEAVERTRALDRDVARFALDPLFHELREAHADNAEVLAHLDDLEQDVLDHLGDFRAGEDEAELPAFLAGVQRQDREDRLSRYRVNVLIDSRTAGGAPVVLERNPTYYALVGRVDYRAAFGTLVTDFRQIKPGALHRANGGFLVLEALDVLRHPFAWDALKRALLTRQVQIENLAEQLSLLPTVSLRPEAIPLALKVILIGPPVLYHLLYALDEDFRELFRVKVDFTPEMDWNEEHVRSYAAFVSRRVHDDGLLHFGRSAVARLVEYGARLRDNQRKLSTRLLDVADVVTEASFWAGKAGRDMVVVEDVDRAVAKKEYRSNLIEERIHELIADGTLKIETSGERPGQINGLSVVDLGDYAFGKPSRVTARIALGRGGVRSIEREIELSGPIHSKGVMILAAYVAGTYAEEWPPALAATVTFEQAYEGVEGDSASSTELYALISAIAGLPLRQSIAVTGSVNQYGEVQAVGGVTTKVEGFYAVCKAKGLTGEQGVLIPEANVSNLMLSDEVVDAVRSGRFHVWAARTVDEGLALLTGTPAGERGRDGSYPEGSVHRLVEDRLRHYAQRLRELIADVSAEAGKD